MKKLLITTMAAASLAFYAKAEFISGINFESTVFTAGTAINTDAGDDGLDTTAGYWSTESEDGIFVISNLTDFADADYWDGVNNSKALFIDSDKPLMRNVNALSGGAHAPRSLADGALFFDSVVQFTATGTAPTPDTTAGDKLIVWLYASEDATTETAPLTNLVITSGTRATGSLSMTNYFTNIAIEPDTWHRLTIKSFIDGGRVYFNVWVDGTQVTSGEVTNFLSLTDPGSQTTDASVTGTTVTGVAFDGKGAVDDLVFTTTDPLAEASYAVTTVLNEVSEDVENAVSAASYKIDSGDYTAFSFGDKLTIPESATELTFKLIVSEGAKLTGGVKNEEEGGASGYYAWTMTVAASTFAKDGTDSVTLTIDIDDGGEDPEEELPTVGGESYETGKAFSEAAKSNTEIKVPTGWELETNNDGTISLLDANKAVYAKFESYYTVTLTDGTVTLAVNDTVKPEVDESTEGAGDAIAVTTDKVTLGITNAKKGLYYTVKAYSDVACTEALGAGDSVKADKDGVLSIPITKPAKVDAAFFKVMVDDKPLVTTEAQ